LLGTTNVSLSPRRRWRSRKAWAKWNRQPRRTFRSPSERTRYDISFFTLSNEERKDDHRVKRNWLLLFPYKNCSSVGIRSREKTFYLPFFCIFFPFAWLQFTLGRQKWFSTKREMVFWNEERKKFEEKRGVPSKKVKTDQFQFSHTSKTTQQTNSERTLRKATTTTRTRTTKTTTTKLRWKKKKKSNTSSTKTATSSRNTFQLSSSTRMTSSKSRSCTLRWTPASSFFHLPPLPRRTCTCLRRNRKRDLPLKTSWVNSSGTKRRSTMRLSRRFNFVLKRLSNRRRGVKNWGGGERKRGGCCVCLAAQCARAHFGFKANFKIRDT